MEIDGTSSASNDSNPAQFSQINNNYYNSDNLYYNNLIVQNKKNEFENYFNKNLNFFDKKSDNKEVKKVDYFNIPKKDNFCNNSNNNNSNNNNNNTMKNNNNNNSAAGGGGGKGMEVKKNFGFENNNFSGKKISEFSDNRKNQIEFFVSKKNGDSNRIHLNNVDAFGKKSISFTPDQVRQLFFNYLILFFSWL